MRKYTTKDKKLALDTLKKDYPHGFDLVYVDYRDSFRENIDELERLLKEGYSQGADDWYFESMWEGEDYVITELSKTTGIDKEVLWSDDDIRDYIRENDTSDIEGDLLRNTGKMLFFIETRDYSSLYSNIDEKLGRREVARIVKRYSKNDFQGREIINNLLEQMYEAPISFYFYLDCKKVYDIIYKEVGEYIAIDGAYFSTIERAIGSNWLGDNACFKIILKREDFIKNVYLDEAKGNGYGWGDIAGQDRYEEAGIFTTDRQKNGYLRIKV